MCVRVILSSHASVREDTDTRTGPCHHFALPRWYYVSRETHFKTACTSAQVLIHGCMKELAFWYDCSVSIRSDANETLSCFVLLSLR